jgi:hypothetical protein
VGGTVRAGGVRAGDGALAGGGDGRAVGVAGAAGAARTGPDGTWAIGPDGTWAIGLGVPGTGVAVRESCGAAVGVTGARAGGGAGVADTAGGIVVGLSRSDGMRFSDGRAGGGAGRLGARSPSDSRSGRSPADPGSGGSRVTVRSFSHGSSC